jgi:hypothetical protein
MGSRGTAKSSRPAPATADLAALTEAQLREDILVPLFQAMGYHDVTERHGMRELGKDIVMWETDKLVTRANIAVMAKRGSISGRADNTQSSAATTANQIRQALGSDYTDPTTSQTYPISRVIVVASGTISEQAQEAIKSQLDRPHILATQYIDGVKLAALVQKYLGGTAAAARAAALRDALKDLNSPLDVNILVTRDKVSVALSPRPGEPLQRVDGQLILEGIDSPEAQRARELLANHIRTGAPATLIGASVHVPEVEEVLRRLGFELPSAGQLSLSARKGRELTLLVRLKADDEERIIGPIRCQQTQVGTEEMTIESLSPARGWSAKVTLSLPTHRADFNLNCDWDSLSATAQHEALLVMSLLARAPLMSIEEHEHGLVLGSSRLEEGLVTPPSTGLVKLLGALSYIEQAKGTPLPLPQRPIEPAEAVAALEVEKLLRGETIEGTWNDASFTLSKVTKEGLEQFSKEELGVIKVNQTLQLDIFGRQIPVGVRQTLLFAPTINRTERRRLLLAYQSGQQSLRFELKPSRKPGRATTRLVESLED